MPSRVTITALLALTASCGGAPASQPTTSGPEAATAPTSAAIPSAANSASPKPTAAAAAPAPPNKLVFQKGDLPGALARAKAEKKLVFIDAWATWCHTCLSMKATVFRDASLAQFQDRVLFVAVDTDREENADFMDRYSVQMLPTFFLVDPTQNDKLLGFWPGSASVSEMRTFLQDGVDTVAALRKGALAEGSPARHLIEARVAHNRGDAKLASQHYAKAIKAAPNDWPRRSEALKGQIQALANSGQVRQCVELGLTSIGEVQGASIPGDFSSVLLACADRLKQPWQARKVRQAVVAKLEPLLADPPALMAPDDVADAWNILAYAYADLRQPAKQKQAIESMLAVLEKAAAVAPDAHAKAAYDYGRGKAYLELGMPEKAVKMLEEREKELPGSAEPPARLSRVLARMGRTQEALAAIERALKHAYGPRKLLFLREKASYQHKLKDTQGAIATMEAVVAGYEKLPAGLSSERSLKDARARLTKLRGQ